MTLKSKNGTSNELIFTTSSSTNSIFTSFFFSFFLSVILSYSEVDVTHIPLISPLDICILLLFSSFGFLSSRETLHLLCKNRINLPLLPQVGHSYRFTISFTSNLFLRNISYFSFLVPCIIEYSLFLFNPTLFSSLLHVLLSHSIPSFPRHGRETGDGQTPCSPLAQNGANRRGLTKTPQHHVVDIGPHTNTCGLVFLPYFLLYDEKVRLSDHLAVFVSYHLNFRTTSPILTKLGTNVMPLEPI